MPDDAELVGPEGTIEDMNELLAHSDGEVGRLLSENERLQTALDKQTRAWKALKVMFTHHPDDPAGVVSVSEGTVVAMMDDIEKAMKL